MTDRSVGWCGTLSERVLEDPPVSFSATEVRGQSDLFAHRASLFYTPTTSIPDEYIGQGTLDITLPIVTPDYTDAIEFRYPSSPRFWVDLIQRQTMKLRWHPLKKARVRITRYDQYKIRNDHLASGAKALLDAFKERTSGRGDGHWLYYFGTIIDDNNECIDLEWHQQCVARPADARTRIHIDPI